MMFIFNFVRSAVHHKSCNIYITCQAVINVLYHNPSTWFRPRSHSELCITKCGMKWLLYKILKSSLYNQRTQAGPRVSWLQLVLIGRHTALLKWFYYISYISDNWIFYYSSQSLSQSLFCFCNHTWLWPWYVMTAEMKHTYPNQVSCYYVDNEFVYFPHIQDKSKTALETNTVIFYNLSTTKSSFLIQHWCNHANASRDVQNTQPGRQQSGCEFRSALSLPIAYHFGY